MLTILIHCLTKDITLSQYDVYEYIIEGTIYYPTSNHSII